MDSGTCVTPRTIEYLERFNAVRGDEDNLYQHYLAGRLNLEETFKQFDERGFKTTGQIRRELVQEFAWAVPTEEALSMIAKYSPIVEMGAGTGYWASLLAERGADVLAFDIAPPDPDSSNHWHPHGKTHFPVLKGTPEILPQYSDRTLLLCWPPYDKPTATSCLNHWKGEILIFIGEGSGGCTADDEFFEIREKDFQEVAFCHIPRWWGIHDTLGIYQRK